MPIEARLLASLLLAATAVYLATPLAIRAAVRFEFYDKPAGYKGHTSATPYLGGAAVSAGFLVAVLLLAGDLGRSAPLLTGIAVLWLVGTADDRRPVAPVARVAIELALALLLWATGLGWDLGLDGGVDLLATAIWVVAVVNAINLFDNMDGASSAIALAVSATVAVLGAIHGDTWLTAAGAALSGACLGFLPHNLSRPSARIFLGDGGSMPVGFAIAALVMAGASRVEADWQALVLGVLLVAIPALDTSLVIISRRRKGISVLTGGRDHLTHRARRRLGDARATATALGALQALIASLALVASDRGSVAIVGLTVVFLAIAAGIITALEYEEDRLHASGDLVVPEAALERARRQREIRPDPPTVGDLALLVLTVGAGISALFSGFYDAHTWVPLGIAVMLVAAVGVIRRPPSPTGRAWLVLLALGGLAACSLLSASWADAAHDATVDGNRWIALAAVFGLAVVLLRSDRRELLAFAGLATGVTIVAGIVLVRMLGDDPASVFLGGRLNDPLGYINAEATVFLMGFWLCVAAAERREAWLAGPALGLATALASLTILSQSRGAAIAAIASVVVVVALVPGRERRVFALLVVAAAVALICGPLFDVFDRAQSVGGDPPADVARAAARAIVLAALAAGVVWGAATLLFERMLGERERERAAAGRAARIALATAAAVALVLGLVSAGRIASFADRQWTAFTHLAEPAGSVTTATDNGARLLSGGGNRYDYWRVAWHAFEAHPVGGVGAGNFAERWFAERTVTEDIRQPHSLELQALSELGLLGGALVALLFAGIGLALARLAGATAGTRAAGAGVAAGGATVSWLVHTSADWQHLLPGVTAIALVTLAALVRRRDGFDSAARPLTRPGGRRALALGVGFALVVGLAGAALTRQWLADRYRADAFADVAHDPRQAIRDADRSLRLDRGAPQTYYAKAAALARLDRGPDATAMLLEAARREPRNWVTWGLLGDLATRRGLAGDAARYYRRALRLNPRDPGLRELTAGGSAPTTG